MELLPVGEDAWRGLYRVEDLARIYVMLGRSDALLQLDPTWDPLRDHPRFRKLVEREP